MALNTTVHSACHFEEIYFWDFFLFLAAGLGFWGQEVSICTLSAPDVLTCFPQYWHTGWTTLPSWSARSLSKASWSTYFLSHLWQGKSLPLLGLGSSWQLAICFLWIALPLNVFSHRGHPKELRKPWHFIIWAQTDVISSFPYFLPLVSCLQFLNLQMWKCLLWCWVLTCFQM